LKKSGQRVSTGEFSDTEEPMRIPLRAVALLFVIGMTSCTLLQSRFDPVPEAALAGKADEEKRAIRQIERLGGRVRVDQSNPRSPALSVCLVGDRFTDASLQRLLDLPQLEELGIYDTQVTDKGLALLVNLPNLRAFSLSGNRVTKDGLKYLAKMTQLQELTLIDTPVGDRDLKYLGGLTNLRKLNLSQYMNVFGGNLEKMELAFDPEGHLTMGVRLKKEITDAGLEHLHGMSRLEELNLCGTMITDMGLKTLTSCKALRSLNLCKTRVSDRGLVYLREMPELRSLDLEDTDVTDLGLVDVRRLQKLRSLRLGHFRTQITDAGLGHLAGLELQELELQGPGITDEGMMAIGRLHELRKLSLNNTKISDRGLELLGRSVALRSLVIYNGSAVTPEGVARLKKARPGLEVDLQIQQRARRISLF
jgi:Leucine-rich repeat (LRR) protein